MTPIQIISITKYPSYVEVSFKMMFTLPAVYGTGANPIQGLNAILSTYEGGGFASEVVSPEGAVITYQKVFSLPTASTLGQIQSGLVSQYNAIRNALDAAVLTPFDTSTGLYYNASAWVALPLLPNFKGRACTFRTPGRAGTVGQKILSLHNATGSIVTVTINKVFVDLIQTVVKAITVLPPVVRLWKVTVLPTNGSALAKNKIGGTTASSSSVTVLGDASADGSGSATTLTATLPAGAILTQEFAPRMITGAGYEAADRMEFLGDTKITLNALEGVVVFLDYTLATQNPVTDMWVAGIEWQEN